MNKERLLKLANHLDNVPVGTFYMPNWVEHTPCGTVACAAGHAAMMPEFIEEGFCLVDEKPFYEVNEDELYGFDACEAFFDLTYDGARNIFSDMTYPGDCMDILPSDVAARIRELVNTN